MMLVLFLTEGGSDVGLGHIRRCLTLATALTHFGVAAEFRVAGGDIPESVVARAGFSVAPISGLDNAPEIAQVARARRPDGIVIDSYVATHDILRSTGVRTIVLDDLADRRLPVNLVINAAIRADRLGYENLTAARLLLGPQYALIRPEFAAAEPRAVRPTIGRILVTLGGGNHGRLLPSVVRWCTTLSPRAVVEVVLGPFAPRTNVDETDKVAILNQPDMAQAMARADLAVTSGGQTLFELAAIGLPAMTIATAANQRHNVMDFSAAETIRSVGERTDPDLERQFADALADVQSGDVRRKMSAHGPRLVDGRGAYRVAAEIVAILRNSNGISDE